MSSYKYLLDMIPAKKIVMLRDGNKIYLNLNNEKLEIEVKDGRKKSVSRNKRKYV